MTRRFSVSDSVVIATDPATAYAQVSDPTLMGRWSPENLGATVEQPRDGAYVGMVFIGANRRGPARWSTRCVVTAAEPGKHFAFRVHAIGLRNPRLRAPIATWAYRFEPVGDGTRVTETWTDDRRSWPDALARVFDAVVTSGHTFADFQQRNICTTLRGLKRALEAGCRR